MIEVYVNKERGTQVVLKDGCIYNMPATSYPCEFHSAEDVEIIEFVGKVIVNGIEFIELE